MGKHNYFTDDGWAFWVDGEDVSTIHLNDWINPKGKNYIDIGLHIRGIQNTRGMKLYVPFQVSSDEIEDISLKMNTKNMLHAIFGVSGLIDYKKNVCTTELAYNGKVLDLVHLSEIPFTCQSVSNGTLISVPFDTLHPYLDNDEAYFFFRLPHKSLDEVFSPDHTVESLLNRLESLLTSPLIMDRYVYSVRINEARMLPPEITAIGAFHRQKLKKASVTIALPDDYEITETDCYRIRRLEESLYQGYLPEGYPSDTAVLYQWYARRDENLRGHFTFYFTLRHEYLKKASLVAYVLILYLVDSGKDLLQYLITNLLGLSG